MLYNRLYQFPSLYKYWMMRTTITNQPYRGISLLIAFITITDFTLCTKNIHFMFYVQIVGLGCYLSHLFKLQPTTYTTKIRGRFIFG
jgi:hypothetical protein